MFKKIIATCLVLMGLALPVHAQDFGVEEIVVTGIRASDDYYETPAITLKKTGDFLVQRVKVVNDSRDKTLREREIRETLQGLASAATRNGNIELSYGDEFLRTLDPKDKTLVFMEERSRADTSYLYFSVKLRVNDKQSPEDQEAALEKFIQSAKKVGRTELDATDDTGLSIVNPEKYRYEVIQQIAAENTRLLEAIGQKCEVQLDGLSNRVQWHRTGITELAIYIPYRTQLLCKHH